MTILKKPKIIASEVYVVDGKEYDTLEAAEKAEAKALEAPKHFNEVVRQHLHRGYGFAKNMKQDDLLQMKGIWRIEDEGPIDFHASGRPHIIAYAAGTFEQVALYAITLPGFRGYGWGSIEPIKIVDLTHT